MCVSNKITSPSNSCAQHSIWKCARLLMPHVHPQKQNETDWMQHTIQLVEIGQTLCATNNIFTLQSSYITNHLFTCSIRSTHRIRIEHYKSYMTCVPLHAQKIFLRTINIDEVFFFDKHGFILFTCYIYMPNMSCLGKTSPREQFWQVLLFIVLKTTHSLELDFFSFVCINSQLHNSCF